MTLVLPPPLTTYPDATNTGPDKTIALVSRAGDLASSATGQTIQALDIQGQFVVKHDNVTLINCIVRGGIDQLTNKKKGFRAWQTSVGTAAGAGVGAGIKGGDMILRRVNIFGVIDGLRAYSNVSLRDSWIHDLFRTEDSAQTSGMTHNDPIQISAGSNIEAVHCRLETWTFVKGQTAGKQDRTKTTPSTSAVGAYAGGGDITNLRVEDCIVQGRAYGYLYAVSKEGHTASVINFINNKFGKDVATADWMKTATAKSVIKSGNVPYTGS